MKTIFLAFVLLAFSLPVRAQNTGSTLPAVELPAELDRVLRDYEAGWKQKDSNALAALFTEDGFILRPGHAPVRGRAAIEEAYRNAGGPLVLEALAYETSGNVGFIIGTYRPGENARDMGKFILALRKNPNGIWQIVADMDNGNEPG